MNGIFEKADLLTDSPFLIFNSDKKKKTLLILYLYFQPQKRKLIKALN